MASDHSIILLVMSGLLLVSTLCAGYFYIRYMKIKEAAKISASRVKFFCSCKDKDCYFKASFVENAFNLLSRGKWVDVSKAYLDEDMVKDDYSTIKLRGLHE